MGFTVLVAAITALVVALVVSACTAMVVTKVVDHRPGRGVSIVERGYSPGQPGGRGWQMPDQKPVPGGGWGNQGGSGKQQSPQGSGSSTPSPQGSGS